MAAPRTIPITLPAFTSRISLPRPSTKSTDPRIPPPREALAEHVDQSSFDRDDATVTVCTAALRPRHAPGQLITRWLRAPDF